MNQQIISAPKNPDPEILDAVIAGAGFGGLAVCNALLSIGITKFLILEKADEVGGTWRENTYPGCACDIPSHLYSLSFAPNPGWSGMFATQPEILDYMKTVASRPAFKQRIRLGRQVRQARWNEKQQVWDVEIADGEIIKTRVFISAPGPLNRPKLPAVEGLSMFKGSIIHSAAWDHSYDFTDKRIAVIGTGASAIQFVPALAKQVGQMTVYQRSPPWIVPKAAKKFDERKLWRFRHVPFYRRYFRYRLFWQHEQRVAGFTTDHAAFGKTEALCRSMLAKQVPDLELRARLTPDYAIGCKRLLISSEYYPAFQRPNVTLITAAVTSVDASGITTADGERREVDAIILGTGFDAVNAASSIKTVGRGGQRLDAALASTGHATLFGTSLPGFPNFFLVTGPNSGLGHNSQVFMIEAQARYIASCLKTLKRRGAAVMEVSQEVVRIFKEELDDRAKSTVWQTGGCRNWYTDPRTGRNVILWPGSAIEFWRRTRRMRPRDYIFSPQNSPVPETEAMSYAG